MVVSLEINSLLVILSGNFNKCVLNKILVLLLYSNSKNIFKISFKYANFFFCFGSFERSVQNCFSFLLLNKKDRIKLLLVNYLKIIYDYKCSSRMKAEKSISFKLNKRKHP